MLAPTDLPSTTVLNGLTSTLGFSEMGLGEAVESVSVAFVLHALLQAATSRAAALS